MDEDLIPPQARANLVGYEALESRLRQAISDQSLNHGWIISGGAGAGKATLAYRIARALLDPSVLTETDTLQMADTGRAFRQISAGAHPDLFVAQRLWDEKKAKYQTEITVETIRKLISFMNRTASGGGVRVAIVDTADDMNRNAANAILKALEEPPDGAILILLSASPGRLLPTIRSRCRSIDLLPLPDDRVSDFLIDEGIDQKTAEAVAPFAKGRPGYALQLATGDGAEAISLSKMFLKAVVHGSDISKVIGSVSGKAGEGRWPVFREIVLSFLADSARRTALGEPCEMFPRTAASALLTAWESLSALVARGEALNLDRAQLVNAMAYDLRTALRQEAA